VEPVRTVVATAAPYDDAPLRHLPTDHHARESSPRRPTATTRSRVRFRCDSRRYRASEREACFDDVIRARLEARHTPAPRRAARARARLAAKQPCAAV
jgi:hypothetical protein